MEFPVNQVLIRSYQVDDGFMNRIGGNYYANVVDGDVTSEQAINNIVGDEFRDYLDRFFPEWRLIRRVDERRRHPRAPRYKIVYLLLVLGTDTDAETVASRLRKKPAWGRPPSLL